jgi:hypothetical protein
VQSSVHFESLLLAVFVVDVGRLHDRRVGRQPQRDRLRQTGATNEEEAFTQNKS